MDILLDIRGLRLVRCAKGRRSSERVRCYSNVTFVEVAPKTAPVSWPTTGQISLTSRVSKMSPHVLIFPTSAEDGHRLFARKLKFYRNLLSLSYSMNFINWRAAVIQLLMLRSSSYILLVFILISLKRITMCFPG